MTAYKFTYFNAKALGESIRMLFHYGGVEFVDDRVNFEDWPKIKPSTPFGQLPVLEVDGKKVVQSSAIARYLAKKFGLAGKDDWEALQIDSTVETIHDLRTKIAAHYYENNAESKAEKLKIAKEMVPFYVNKLDEQVKKNGGYFVGGKLSWAEFVFVGLLEYLNYTQGCDIIAKAENLKALRDTVLAIPSIKTWVAKRPKTEF
ncbi:glutathione S-transferase-like [Phymastichus coffea]|uniref:glutathione S-transferase-like n=1 Tax=Phymastichus coffea TaxID=108790 RepID=UPI00273B8752|nr:glutathione S-transferase-like [Phymastichus coffea]XP_058796256.1 glutathione S-transferase-like [Phymastichus coffea]XP_058796257.1 glutathione S-transferase-like [Phymastichus coffea]